MKWGTRSLALLTPLALATAAFGQVVVSTGTPAAITDNALTVIPIAVAGGPASITDVNIIIRLTHTFQADLDMILVAPDGRFCHLSTDNGGGNDDWTNVRLDGAAAASITTITTLPVGNFRPEGGNPAFGTQWSGTGANALPAGPAVGSLAAFNGAGSDGTWNLWVYDDAGGDTGSVNYVALEFNGAVDATGPAVATLPGPVSFVSQIISPAAAPYINGDTIVYAVSVTPGEGPASTGLTVSADATAIGGVVGNLLDNGVAPDAVAGDFIYTGSRTLTGLAAATYNVPITVSDAEARVSGPTNLAVTVSAGAQGLPTAAVDLGSIPNPTNNTGTLTGFTSGGGVKWIKMTIPTVDIPSNTFLDIDTNGAGTGNTFTNSTIALYNDSGNRISAQDTDDGASLFSMLSYGLTTPTRPADAFIAPATAVGLAHAGVDGASLPAGTYWLGVGGTGVTFQTTNWRYTGTSTQVGDCAYHISLGSNTTQTNPTATGVATPASGIVGSSTLLTVTVVPGTNPVSSGISVVGNLAGIGGSASQSFFDNGTNGDVTAGDNIFSFNATVGAVPGGAVVLPVTVADAQARGASASINFFVSAPPAVFTDLGNANCSSISRSDALNGSTINWYRLVVPAIPNAAGNFMDMWTNSTGTVSDTEMGLYDDTGALIASNDDGGNGLKSQLTFGDTSAPRPNLDTLDFAPNGVNGTLAGGTYWLAVGVFNVTYNTGWNAVSTGTATGTVELRINVSTPGCSSNPSGTGTGGVVNGCGGSVLATVAVTPGASPPSTNLAVSLNTAAIGGGSVAMFDNGTNGDVTAGDNIFSLSLSIPGGADATFNLPFNITDAQARSGSGSLTVTRSGTEVGDLPATAQTYYGSSGTTIAGTIGGGTDVDMFAICVSDTANFEASVNNGGAAFDTQLFLFNADGTGAAMNDDEPDVAGTLQSHMMLNNSLLPTAPAIVLPSGGLYYLAISPYNRDPISSAVVTDLIWNNTATTPAGSFDATWAPNGVTPTLPVVGWTNTGNAGGAFTITMVGGSTICPADLSNSNLSASPDCAVDINDLLYFLTAFETGNADVDNGSGTGSLDCATDINDLLFFLVHFEVGC